MDGGAHEFVWSQALLTPHDLEVDALKLDRAL